VSGALVAGTIVDLFDPLSHLTGVQEINPEKMFDEMSSFRTTLQLASLYRLYGHDFTIYRNDGDAGFTPYSSVRTSVIDPYSMGFSSTRRYHVEEVESATRDGRKAPLPNVNVLQQTDKVTVIISKPTLTLCEWGDKFKQLKPVRFTKRIPKTVTFNVRAGASSSRILARGLRKPKQEAGFHKGEDVIAPMIPIIVDPGSIIVQDTAATSNDA